jgi:hypothetical protein
VLLSTLLILLVLILDTKKNIGTVQWNLLSGTPGVTGSERPKLLNSPG